MVQNHASQVAITGVAGNKISVTLEEIKIRHKCSVENCTPKKLIDVTLVAEDYQYIQGHKVIFQQKRPNKVKKSLSYKIYKTKEP